MISDIQKQRLDQAAADNADPDCKSPGELIREARGEPARTPDIPPAIQAELISQRIVLAHIFADHLAIGAALHLQQADETQSRLQKESLATVLRLEISGEGAQALRDQISAAIVRFFDSVAEAAKVMDAHIERRSGASGSTN